VAFLSRSPRLTLDKVTVFSLEMTPLRNPTPSLANDLDFCFFDVFLNARVPIIQGAFTPNGFIFALFSE
jgi:hypothetical protein